MAQLARIDDEIKIVTDTLDRETN
ncbi:hypothetical protein SBA4_5580013 [Candidatus Sulfopaludibacter sp. SbA4]|nr:hypothetical protein SBA4_5580013 [Candidatus Sulfopaludibacter sp. SbA4]